MSEEQQYSVVMHTPLGKKYGTLTAVVSDNSVSGWLDVLKHRERFEGRIDNDGNCEIAGKLITLMRTIPFTATGKMTFGEINLQLSDGRNVFKLTGSVCPKADKA